jgi:hypothetical protein
MLNGKSGRKKVIPSLRDGERESRALIGIF